eukprot:PhM_4_TR8143/c0_g1_i1/m.100444/K21278/DUSP1; dual specificity protein phosphatase 1
MTSRLPRPCALPIVERRISFSTVDLPSSDDVNHDSNRNNTITEVIQGFLYLGGVLDALNGPQLRGLGITRGLCVAKECCDVDISHNEFAVLRKIPMTDNSRQNLRGNIAEALEFIESVRAEGSKVIVFCRKGASRSASVVLAYLMFLYSVPYSEALTFLQSSRGVVDPNLGFRHELEVLDRDLSPHRAVHLQQQQQQGSSDDDDGMNDSSILSLSHSLTVEMAHPAMPKSEFCLLLSTMPPVTPVLCTTDQHTQSPTLIQTE